MPELRSCDHCGTAYSRPPSLVGKFCSKGCAYAARRRVDVTVRRIRYQPGHPLAAKGGYISEARVVLFDKIGVGPHACHWCGRLLHWVIGVRGYSSGSVIADHLNSDPLDDRPQNLVPACGYCNVERARAIGDDEQYVLRASGTRLRVGDRRNCRHCGDEFTTTATLRSFCMKHRRAKTRQSETAS